MTTPEHCPMSRLTSVSHTARYQVALTQSERREPTLTLVRGPGMGRVFPLLTTKRSYVLGRESTCDLFVDDHTVSRSHARFDVRQVEGLDTVVRIRDLGSTNGTWLNGQRIQEAIINPGDKIHVGEVILRFDLLDNIDRGFAFRAAAGEAPTRRGDPQVEATFQRAIAGIWLAYQPIVSWVDRRIIGWEALLRAEEPGLQDPHSLIALAERLGRVWEVGRIARARAADAAAELPPGTLLFVNLHPSDIRDDDLYQPTSPLSRVAHRVVLEITERASLDGVSDLDHRVARLRRLGFQIAVDDLGAGYAALSVFAQLSPEIVKIDMGIVRDVHKSPTKARVIRSLADMCRDMGVRMIVEGVETVEEQQKVIELGCDLLQGYLFAKPVRDLPGTDTRICRWPNGEFPAEVSETDLMRPRERDELDDRDPVASAELGADLSS